MNIRDMHELRVRAISNGGVVVSSTMVEWSIAGGCLAPATRELWAVPKGSKMEDGSMQRVQEPGQQVPIGIRLHCACRKCEWCLRHRAYEWWKRAEAEYEAAVRTWFVTLTLAPENHFLMASRAERRLSAEGCSWSQLTQEQQFAQRHYEISIEITKYLKRVRKNSDAELRYLLICEKHTGARKEVECAQTVEGLPHYHLLVHETDTFRPVRKRCLEQAWPFGFVDAKLATDPRSATYLTKYLSKSAEARVRASIGYGKVGGVLGDVPPTLPPSNRHDLDHRERSEEDFPTLENVLPKEH